MPGQIVVLTSQASQEDSWTRRESTSPLTSLVLARNGYPLVRSQKMKSKAAGGGDRSTVVST